MSYRCQNCLDHLPTPQGHRISVIFRNIDIVKHYLDSYLDVNIWINLYLFDVYCQTPDIWCRKRDFYNNSHKLVVSRSSWTCSESWQDWAAHLSQNLSINDGWKSCPRAKNDYLDNGFLRWVYTYSMTNDNTTNSPLLDCGLHPYFGVKSAFIPLFRPNSVS